MDTNVIISIVTGAVTLLPILGVVWQASQLAGQLKGVQEKTKDLTDRLNAVDVLLDKKVVELRNELNREVKDYKEDLAALRADLVREQARLDADTKKQWDKLNILADDRSVVLTDVTNNKVRIKEIQDKLDNVYIPKSDALEKEILILKEELGRQEKK